MQTGADVMGTPVTEVMTRSPRTVGADELGSAAVHVMEQFGVMALPALDADGRLAGVVHLVCDVDHVQAEYAVLVTDNWQGRGLGTRLTEYCLEIAASWGLTKVIGETEKHNHRMLATFRRYGFELTYGKEYDDPVLAIKHMSPSGIVEKTIETFAS